MIEVHLDHSSWVPGLARDYYFGSWVWLITRLLGCRFWVQCTIRVLHPKSWAPTLGSWISSPRSRQWDELWVLSLVLRVLNPRSWPPLRWVPDLGSGVPPKFWVSGPSILICLSFCSSLCLSVTLFFQDCYFPLIFYIKLGFSIKVMEPIFMGIPYRVKKGHSGSWNQDFWNLYSESVHQIFLKLYLTTNINKWVEVTVLDS